MKSAIGETSQVMPTVMMLMAAVVLGGAVFLVLRYLKKK